MINSKRYKGVAVWMRDGSRFEFDNGRTWNTQEGQLKIWDNTKDEMMIAEFKAEDVLAVFNSDSSGYIDNQGTVHSLG